MFLSLQWMTRIFFNVTQIAQIDTDFFCHTERSWRAKRAEDTMIARRRQSAETTEIFRPVRLIFLMSCA